MSWFARMLDANCCGGRNQLGQGKLAQQPAVKDGSTGSVPRACEVEGVESVKEPEVSQKQVKMTKSTNSAFVFIKPGALTDKVKDLVERKLRDAGISILDKGEITGEDIERKQLVDHHYYSIASKATLLQPTELNMPKEKFREFASIDWEDALALGWAFNALDACDYLEVTPEELDRLWSDAKKGATGWVKLGGGFQCARILVEGKDPVFVLNGFFLSMRSKFLRPGPAVYWYTVEWDASELSWADFRGRLLGATDPAEASPGSLRRQLLDNWRALGLAAQPTVGENGVHASASPLEALTERCNWRGGPVREDPFGALLMDAGLSEDLIQEWRLDPQVTVAGNTTASLFDQLEDMDTAACIERCVQLKKLQA